MSLWDHLPMPHWQLLILVPTGNYLFLCHTDSYSLLCHTLVIMLLYNPALHWLVVSWGVHTVPCVSCHQVIGCLCHPSPQMLPSNTSVTWCHRSHLPPLLPPKNTVIYCRCWDESLLMPHIIIVVIYCHLPSLLSSVTIDNTTAVICHHWYHHCCHLSPLISPLLSCHPKNQMPLSPPDVFLLSTGSDGRQSSRECWWRQDC